MPKLVADGLNKEQFEEKVNDNVVVVPQPKGGAPALQASTNAKINKPYSKTGIDKYVIDDYDPNCCCPFTNPETVGFVFVGSFSVGVTIMSNLFISAALLELALKEAGCGYLFADDVDDDPPSCKKKVYGMHPANLYLVMATIAALTIACLNPFIGALIDHTRFRKSLAAGTLFSLAIIQFVQMSISKDTWFFVMILQIPAIAGYFLHSATYSAYLPELSDSLMELNRASATSTKYLFITEISFVLFVAVVSSILFGADDSVNACRLSQGLSGAGLLYSSFHVYGRFMKSRPKPKITLSLTMERGLTSLKDTLKEMAVEFPMVRRYLVATMFLEAAMGAFSNIAAVFIVNQLGASGSQFALIILVLLVTGAMTSPVASWVSKKSAEKYGDVHSGLPPLCASVVWLTVVTCFAPVLMQKPADLPIAYLFGVFWGIGMGFYYSLLKPVYFFITPGGQESKFSGLFAFFQTIISWAPLLGFSIALSVTGSMAGGFIIMAVFLFIGLLFLVNIDMEAAHEKALSCDTLRYKNNSFKEMEENRKSFTNGGESL
mmetsp:Transcript_16208/g.21007  ORF Transcript_16208/g.21007 Transcript_16208/m.21007 type:complete len:548 (+) Transcript_16208:50-1693(+)